MVPSAHHMLVTSNEPMKWTVSGCLDPVMRQTFRDEEPLIETILGRRMGHTLKNMMRYADPHRRQSRTLRRNHLPPEQLLAECLDVWKARLILESWKPVSRYDGVNLSLRAPLHLWIEGERNEEGGHRARGLNHLVDC